MRRFTDEQCEELSQEQTPKANHSLANQSEDQEAVSNDAAMHNVEEEEQENDSEATEQVERLDTIRVDLNDPT